MSAIGTKRTSLVALHMSAIGGKADTALRRTFPLRDGECSPLENRLQQQ